jgi:hypothetical protein
VWSDIPPDTQSTVGSGMDCWAIGNHLNSVRSCAGGTGLGPGDLGSKQHLLLGSPEVGLMGEMTISRQL